MAANRGHPFGKIYRGPWVAIAGDTEVTEKLLKGYKVGDMTYKVHLDG